MELVLVDERLICQVTKTIADRFQPRRIVLFGSRARGDARPDSDLDIFVEMDSNLPPVDRARLIRSAFPGRDWAMDVFVYTPEEARRLRGVHGTLMAVIEQEGKVLYEQG